MTAATAQNAPGSAPAGVPAVSAVPSPFLLGGKHRALWVPRCVAGGRGPAEGSPRLTGHQILVYLDRLNRADNSSGQITAETIGCSARTGLTPETVRIADDRLVKAGLLTVKRLRRRGNPAVYVVTRGTLRNRIDVPPAAIWPTDAADCPPRWPHADSGAAVRTLLAILRSADYETGLVVGTRGTPYSAEQIAKGANLSTTDYWRGLAVLIGPGPSTGSLRKDVAPRTNGWLTNTPQTRARKGATTGEVTRVQQPSLVKVDWAALPAQEVIRTPLRLAPALDENADAADLNEEIPDTGEGDRNPEIPDTDTTEIRDTEQAGNPGHGASGKSRTVSTSPGTAATQMLSSTDAPSPQASQPPTSAATAQPQAAEGGGKASQEDVFDDENLATWLTKASRDEVDQRLRAAIAAAGSREVLSDAWWATCVWANLRHAKDGHPLHIDVRDLARLEPQLLARRPAYSALDLAAALSDQPSRTARSHVGVLVDRLNKLPVRPVVPVRLPEDAPWLTTSPAAQPGDAAAPWIRAIIAAVDAEDWNENAWEGPDGRYRWTSAGDHITWTQDRDQRVCEYVRVNPSAETDLAAWRAAIAPSPAAFVDRDSLRGVDRATAEARARIAAGGTDPYDIDGF